MKIEQKWLGYDPNNLAKKKVRSEGFDQGFRKLVRNGWDLILIILRKKTCVLKELSRGYENCQEMVGI